MLKSENNVEKQKEFMLPKIDLLRGNNYTKNKNEGKVITDEMVKEISDICKRLFMDSDKFDNNISFNEIHEYIKKYKRIIYSQISSEIYACYDREICHFYFGSFRHIVLFYKNRNFELVK